MGAGTGTYEASFEGNGQIIWAASCSATSNASIRGNWKITDNAGGAVTETLDDNQTSVDAILVDTGTTIPATLGTPVADIASDLLTAAEVNAEVVDVLFTDTDAEPTGVPAATATLADKIGYLYMALRNKITITATKKTFFDDGDAAEWEKDLTDDGTTYTETEGNSI